MPGVANAHVGALETAGKVVFLYNVTDGPADRAYGVQVARLAGLPPAVADRATALLAAWEADGGRTRDVRKVAEPTSPSYDAGDADSRTPAQLLAETDAETRAAIELVAALHALDLDGLTPREALTWLWVQRDRLGTRDHPSDASGGTI